MKVIEYKCSWCGSTRTRTITQGRPDPGTYPRRGKTLSGTTKPHVWVKSRILGK